MTRSGMPWRRIAGLALAGVRAVARERRRIPATRGRGPTPSTSGYPGDFTGAPIIDYTPVPDDRPDPGEVVWTWVPFEEDHARGKDRPVLVIGRDGAWLLALQLTSQDHDRDAADESRRGRRWVDVGSGEWDRERRPSEARVDRILRIDPDQVRRIGAVLSRRVFDEVARAVGERRTG